MKDATTVTTLFPGKLTVCTYDGFAPVCFKDEHGFTGLDVVFLEKFVKWLNPKLKLNLHIEFVKHEFDGIWKAPHGDLCDIAGAGVQKRDDRPVGDGASWSDDYFNVKRSLLIRKEDRDAFSDFKTLTGKTIIVTKGSTADYDAEKRYRGATDRNTIKFVSDVAKNPHDLKDPEYLKWNAQKYIVEELILKHEADAFGEGDVSNKYLSDEYGKGLLELADKHDIDGVKESFNFITRNASSGILEQLNNFIKDNMDSYPDGLKPHCQLDPAI